VKTTPIRVIRAGEKAKCVWLIKNGFHGLYTPNDNCGCWREDLYPCGERGDRLTCVPGHEFEDGTGIGPARNLG